MPALGMITYKGLPYGAGGRHFVSDGATIEGYPWLASAPLLVFKHKLCHLDGKRLLGQLGRDPYRGEMGRRLGVC